MTDPQQLQALIEACIRQIEWRNYMAQLREEQREKRRRRKRERTKETAEAVEDPE